MDNLLTSLQDLEQTRRIRREPRIGSKDLDQASTEREKEASEEGLGEALLDGHGMFLGSCFDPGPHALLEREHWLVRGRERHGG